MKILTMRDGKKYAVLKEVPRYYICKDARFKKSNPNIIFIEEVIGKEKPEPEVIPEVEVEAEKKEDQKKPQKAQKKTSKKPVVEKKSEEDGE